MSDLPFAFDEGVLEITASLVMPMNVSAARTECGVPEIPPHLAPVLRLLLEGYEYAHELRRDVWDFSLAIQCLRRQGHSDSGLRWLTCKGLVQHASETTPRGQRRRTFLPEGELELSERSCFVLTDAGAASARALATVHQARDPEAEMIVRLDHHQEAQNRPHWDSQRRQLLLGDEVVKKFKRPAANQELILAAFEEEGWPPRIDDPLSPSDGIDSKQRLHDAIQRLNQHQVRRLLRFRGDGNGTGVLWEREGIPSDRRDHCG